jgi:hypothetical protein
VREIRNPFVGYISLELIIGVLFWVGKSRQKMWLRVEDGFLYEAGRLLHGLLSGGSQNQNGGVNCQSKETKRNLDHVETNDIDTAQFDEFRAQ